MTTPLERTRALFAAGDVLKQIFLLEPAAPINESTRLLVQHALRHYPDKDTLEVLVRDVTSNCPRPMLSLIYPNDNPPAPARQINRHADLDTLKHKISCEVLARFGLPEIRRKSLENIERWRSQGTFGEAYSAWSRILLAPGDSKLISAMVGTGERSNQLRQSMPYVGMLDQEIVERLKEDVGQ